MFRCRCIIIKTVAEDGYLEFLLTRSHFMAGRHHRVQRNPCLSPRLYFSMSLQTIKMILSRPMKFVFMNTQPCWFSHFFWSIRISLACLIRNSVQKEINRLRIGNTCKNEGKKLISSFQIFLSAYGRLQRCTRLKEFLEFLRTSSLVIFCSLDSQLWRHDKASLRSFIRKARIFKISQVCPIRAGGKVVDHFILKMIDHI